MRPCKADVESRQGAMSADLDDLHQLVDAGFAREQGLPQEQLRHDAADGPDVDGRRVVRRPKDELRRPVVPAAVLQVDRQDARKAAPAVKSTPQTS